MDFEPTLQQRRFIEASVRSGLLLRAHEMVEWRRYEAWMEETRERLRQGLEALDRGEFEKGERAIRSAEERIDRFREEIDPESNGKPAKP